MTTYAKIPAALVVQACQEFTRERDLRIFHEREEAIAEAMRPTIILRRRRTREQAISYLQRTDHGRWFSQWNEIAMTGANQASRVEKLQNLASIACAHSPDSLIHLDTEAARDLKDYL